MLDSFSASETEKPKEVVANDSLTKYFNEISTVKVLNAQEERALITKYKETEDKVLQAAIRDKIIKSALKFVIAEARRHHRSRDRAAFQDLIAAGNIGLLRALTKFDLSQGTRFLTYAGWWVRHEMREENKHLNLCHIPTHAISKGVTTPTPIEFTDSIAQTDLTDNPVDLFHDHQSMTCLLDAAILTVRERFIVKTCFGIDTTPKTLRQVGKVLVITGERVRQLRESALSKMRNVAIEHEMVF